MPRCGATVLRSACPSGPSRQRHRCSAIWKLASVIRQGKKDGIFYKNTLDVVPNVGGMFSEDQECYYYVEAYNLQAGSDTGDYITRTNLFDAIGKEVITRDRTRKRVGESSVIIDHFPAKTLRTGTYTVTLSILGSDGKPVSTAGRKLFVFNPTWVWIPR